MAPKRNRQDSALAHGQPARKRKATRASDSEKEIVAPFSVAAELRAEILKTLQNRKAGSTC